MQKVTKPNLNQDMITKVFWIDPYKTSHRSKVKSVNGQVIRLDETIFFAFSGGQESDHGTIAGYPVLEARKSGKDIEYRLPENHTLREGDLIETKIDWERRYALMRLHFAAEIVLELVYKTYPGIERIGAHIGEEKARLDFKMNESIGPVLPDLEASAQALIEEDHEIESAFSDEAQENRFWQIEGFAKVPCAGTHLKRTSEIGEVKLKRNNIGKGKERVEIYLV